MSATAAELLTAVLKLPPDEQEALAEQLNDHLHPPDRDIDRMTEEEFEAELNRRREESLRNPSVMLPWEEVRRQLMAEFADDAPGPPARAG